MIRSYCGQVLLALLFCSPNGISGFTTIADRNGSSRSMILRASSETTLELKGVVEVSSNPLPSLPADKMASFFEATEIRNMLVTAGGKRPCEELSAAGAILQEWKEACSVVGAELPGESDSPLSVKTGGIDFPGLRLESKAKIGAKLISEPSPRYEFVLIGDEQTVTGLPPVKWVYNKLTGNDGEKSGSNSSTSSLTTISYDETNDGKTVIKSNASLSISVKFPSILLKIMPTNKEKAEETGGNALCKTLEKDVQASMDAVEKAYLKFVEEANSTASTVS